MAKGKGRAGGAAARWLYSVLLAERNQRRYPGRYMVVQFEAMVRQPEQTLQAVCDFLGETYYPEMLLMEGDPERRAKLVQRASEPTGVTPLSTEFIGTYYEAVPPAEIAFIQSVAGRRMTAFGYQLDSFQLPVQEQLRYTFLEWPLNLGRMLAWLGLEFAQHHLPGLFGRKPDSRQIIDSHTAAKSDQRDPVIESKPT